MAISSGDFIEWVTVLLMVPLGTLAFFLCFVTSLYVYFDVEKRSQGRFFAALFALAIALCYWPISFLMYLACTAIIDRRRPSADENPARNPN